MTSVDDISFFDQKPMGPVEDWLLFDHPVWAKSIKLLMKGPPKDANQFGIYRFDAWTKNYKVMLRSKMQSNYCLVVANGQYEGDSTMQL